MKNAFGQLKRGLSMMMILALFLTQFSSFLFQTPKTYAINGLFSATETVANQTGVAGVTGIAAQTQFNVFTPGIDGYQTSIADCVISITSVGLDDLDCTDGFGSINSTSSSTEAQQAVVFGNITFSGYDSDFTGTQSFVLTYNLIPRIDGFVPNMYVSGSFISTNILATGVADIPAIPAVAQVVGFSPTVVTADETYRATINGIDYNYTVSMGDTVQTVVEALQVLMDANADVTCSEDDVIITCTADLAGTAFTYGTTVLDITPPVVTLSGSTPITIAQGSTYSDAGAIWTDSEDGSGTISTATSGTVDTNTVGTYILEYTYTDMAGNTGNIVMRTVNVTDQTTPVVVLSGGDTSIGWGSAYSDDGATWTDNVDGSGFISNANSGSVNSYQPGVYTLEYWYTDTSSNVSNIVTRIVTVNNPGIPDPQDDSYTIPQDTILELHTPPDVVVFNDNNMEFTASGGIVTPPTYGTYIMTGQGFTYYPNTGFAGVDTLTYQLCNILNECDTAVVTITVLDTQAPVVTLSGSTPITIAQGSGYSDAGATWTDNADGNGIISSPTSGTVNTALLGTYTLEYTYIDMAGNTGNTVTRTVNVTDQTAPVVTLSGLTSLVVYQGTNYSEAGAKWTDNVDGSGFIAIPTSGTVNTGVIGIYILTYTYIDVAGNTGSATRTVSVVAPFLGGGSIYRPYTLESVPTITTPVTQTPVVDIDDLFNPTIDSTICFTPNNKKIIDQGNNVSANFMKAQQLLLNFDLTTIPGTRDYSPQRSLTRAEAAKFLSLFAQNILCRETTKAYPQELFKDLDETDSGLQSYIILSYEYEIFRGDVGGIFRPNDTISRDELIAVIVRLVTNEYSDAQGADRAANYKAILNDTTSIPLTTVRRGNTAEVIYDLYRNNNYSLETDLGYVLR